MPENVLDGSPQHENSEHIDKSSACGSVSSSYLGNGTSSSSASLLHKSHISATHFQVTLPPKVSEPTLRNDTRKATHTRSPTLDSTLSTVSSRGEKTRYHHLNRDALDGSVKKRLKSELRSEDENYSKEICVEIGTNSHYIKCKRGVTGKQIREYQRRFAGDLSEIEMKLFQFAISAMEKRKSFWNHLNTELRIYSNDPCGYNPVFYSGLRTTQCIVIWQEGVGPEFIEVDRHWWNAMIPQGFFIKVFVILVVLTLVGLYIYIMFNKVSDLLIGVSQSILATIKIEGNSVSDVNLDNLDINVRLLSNKG